MLVAIKYAQLPMKLDGMKLIKDGIEESAHERVVAAAEGI